jgi:hypothetical protein
MLNIVLGFVVVLVLTLPEKFLDSVSPILIL